MANTYENINLVKQRTRWATRKPGASEALKALFIHMEQLGNPDLQLVAFDTYGAADVVIANVACKLYAVFFKKVATSTTAGWLKISNNTTTCASSTSALTILLSAAAAACKEEAVCFNSGLSLSTGATLAQHTATDSNADSDPADSCAGFCIIGAP